MGEIIQENINFCKRFDVNLTEFDKSHPNYVLVT